MFFTGFTGLSKKARRQRLDQVNDVAASNRAVIKARLQEVTAVDQQLFQVVSETKTLTNSIKDKLSTHLKITRNTLKSICQNLKEGVILVDYTGSVIEVNNSCERTFSLTKEAMLGKSFSQICDKLNAIKEDGGEIHLTQNFFNSLSTNIFTRINCKRDCKTCTAPDCLKNVEDYFKGEFNPQIEVMLRLQPPGYEKSVKCSFSFSVLDNDPESVEDITYILFFKILPAGV